jgi:hypothetical protein
MTLVVHYVSYLEIGHHINRRVSYETFIDFSYKNLDEIYAIITH